MSVNQKVVEEFKKAGYVINNNKVLCAQSAKADRYSNLNKVFYKKAWTLVTEEEALKLQGCKDDDGQCWLKFAYIPLERVPQFNSSLPNPEETVEEVVINKQHFAKKAPAAAPAKPVDKIQTVNPDLTPASDNGGDAGDESTGDEDEFDKAFGGEGSDESDGQEEGGEEGEGESPEGQSDEAGQEQKPIDSEGVERKELMKKTVPELKKILKDDLGIQLKGNEKKEELIELILG